MDLKDSINGDLIHYCKLDDENNVSLLLKKGTFIDNADENGIALLHIVSAIGAENVLNTLLSNGANIDKNTNMGWTPLMCAARNGCSRTVQQLVEKGADINHRNNFGVSILSMGIASSNREVIEILLNESDTNMLDDVISPLHVAALQGHCSILQLLLCSHPHLVNICDKYGVTPLMLAVAGNQEAAVKILLNSGADVNLKNSNRYTALDIAITKRDKDIICLLKNKTDERMNHLCNDFHYMSVGSDLVEQYGWSSICTPKFKRSKRHKDRVTYSHNEDALSSLPVLSISSNNVASHVIENNTNFVSRLFSPINWPLFNKSTVTVCESSEKNTPVATKSSTPVPVPPVSPYTPSLPVCMLNFPKTDSQNTQPSCSNFTYPYQNHSAINCSSNIPQYCGNYHDCCVSKEYNSEANNSKVQSEPEKESCGKFRKAGKIENWARNFLASWQRNTNTKNTQNCQKKLLNLSENSTRTPKGKIPSKLQIMEEKCCSNNENKLSSTFHSFSTLTNLLVNLKLQKYLPLFFEHEVDMDAFMMLNQKDLEEIGITSPNSQNKLLKVIMTFKGEFN